MSSKPRTLKKKRKRNASNEQQNNNSSLKIISTPNSQSTPNYSPSIQPPPKKQIYQSHSNYHSHTSNNIFYKPKMEDPIDGGLNTNVYPATPSDQQSPVSPTPKLISRSPKPISPSSKNISHSSTPNSQLQRSTSQIPNYHVKNLDNSISNLIKNTLMSNCNFFEKSINGSVCPPHEIMEKLMRIFPCTITNIAILEQKIKESYSNIKKSVRSLKTPYFFDYEKGYFIHAPSDTLLERVGVSREENTRLYMSKLLPLKHNNLTDTYVYLIFFLFFYIFIYYLLFI